MKCFEIGLTILLCCTFSPARGALLSHWKFDETAGLTALDTGGAIANDAVWQDATSTNLSWGPGKIGNAAILTGANGSSNVFNVGSIEADGATQLSYSVWIKPELTQVGNLDKGFFTTGTLEALRSGGPTANQFWGATWKDGNKFRVDATGTYTSGVVYDGSETEPEWIHLAFTWDGTAGNPTPGDEEVKTYINGVLVNTGTRNAAQILDDGNWQIGRDRTFADRAFAGMIDDLIVVDTVLTDDQVALVYSSGLNGTDAAAALGLPGRVPEPAAFGLIAAVAGLAMSRRMRLLRG